MTEPTPFDIDAAKRGEPIMTRKGILARFIALDEPTQTLLVAINGCVNTRNPDGKIWVGISHENDIVMAPKKRNVTVRLWLNKTANTLIATINYIFPRDNWTLIKEEVWEVPE